MKFLKSLIVAGLIVMSSTVSSVVSANPIFSDNFDNGAKPEWGNERGGWIVTNGAYASTAPNNNPQTLSSLPFELTDFTIDVDINTVADGGIWLRAEFDINNTPINGVLLVTGGFGGANGGFYFHNVVNGSFSAPLNNVNGLFTPGTDDISVHIEVEGDLYSVFLNGGVNPVTTLNNSDHASGQTGLYDFSSQSFDNFEINAIPEPSTLVLLTMAGAMFLRKRKA